MPYVKKIYTKQILIIANHVIYLLIKKLNMNQSIIITMYAPYVYRIIVQILLYSYLIVNIQYVIIVLIIFIGMIMI